MKSIRVNLAAVAVCFALASQYAASAAAQTERVVYSFCIQRHCADGKQPYANLIKVKGTLFGTTTEGGAKTNSGTVFAFDPNTGAETVVHSFLCSEKRCNDGQYPYAGLIDVNGALYGTTIEGGGTACGVGCGTVFSLDPNTDAETVLYSFHGTDGRYPEGLIDVEGTLYGTTTQGGTGAYCSTTCGTVFSLDPATGVETVLYSFCNQPNCADGAEPTGGLIDVHGTLYGTTLAGGNIDCSYGCGTVFSLDPKTGAEKLVYAFCSEQNCADGESPFAGLIDVAGKLYGTTYEGGTGGYCSPGCGTVFLLDVNTGTETVVHQFGNGTDGQYPYAGLVDVKGTLYGTTLAGGGVGGGTVFALDPNTGTETVLHAFPFCEHYCTDGQFPYAGLVEMNGTLYGTTKSGGANCQNDYGCGTVFALTSP